MALQLWETIKESIETYTGLSPSTFFTVIAMGLALHYVISRLFGSSDRGHRQRSTEVEEVVRPLPPPVQVGEILEEDLKQYDGSDPQKPLLMAIKSQIYDVTQSRMFYGPGGPYALFAGKDASRALAKLSFEEKDLTGDISGLGVYELEALQDWEYKFMSKYVKVGTVKKAVPVSDGEPATTSNDPAVRGCESSKFSDPPEPSSGEPKGEVQETLGKTAENGHKPASNGGEGSGTTIGDFVKTADKCTSDGTNVEAIEEDAIKKD